MGRLLSRYREDRCGLKGGRMGGRMEENKKEMGGTKEAKRALI